MEIQPDVVCFIAHSKGNCDGSAVEAEVHDGVHQVVGVYLGEVVPNNLVRWDNRNVAAGGFEVEDLPGSVDLEHANRLAWRFFRQAYWGLR